MRERIGGPLGVWWAARGLTLRDSGLAVALTAAALIPGSGRNGILFGELGPHHLSAVGVLLVMAQSLPLAARRRRPTGCLLLVTAAFSAYQLAGFPATVAGLGVLVALYSAGAHLDHGRTAVAATATAAYGLLAAALHLAGSPERPVDYLTFYLVLLACWAGGAWVRGRQRGEAERRRHSSAAAVADERARIARDLHDVVTHHVTAMVIQSDAAQFLLEPAPGRAADGLTAISDTGRRALADLRSLLDVLHEPAGHHLSGRTPALGHLTDLVEQSRLVGQPVQFREDGTRPPLPVGVELAVYRVVQEALTNAVKHAPGCRTAVVVHYRGEAVDISVENDAPLPAPPAPVPGHGLTGLRERVSLLHGVFCAGPRPGGFSVTAHIPRRGHR